MKILQFVYDVFSPDWICYGPQEPHFLPGKLAISPAFLFCSKAAVGNYVFLVSSLLFLTILNHCIVCLLIIYRPSILWHRSFLVPHIGQSSASFPIRPRTALLPESRSLVPPGSCPTSWCLDLLLPLCNACSYVTLSLFPAISRDQMTAWVGKWKGCSSFGT